MGHGLLLKISGGVGWKGRGTGFRRRIVGAGCACVLALASGGLCADRMEGGFNERFSSLAHWRPLTFHGIERRSEYRSSVEEGTPCLLMQSQAGASALLMKDTFNVYALPRLSWRWKVSNVYTGGDGSKQGDDYPARIYIMFAYDPDKASLMKRLRYEAAKLVHDEYPPDSSLSYIWANRDRPAEFLPSPYTDQLMMIPVDGGSEHVGSWREYSVDVVADYRRAFGCDPPETAALAVMIDSDDTGESARAWIGFIRLSP